MVFAVLDFDVERFRLMKLMIALLQPVLLMALCLGFVVASVHLLTMLSTRWGHRRVSSKAMMFSIAIHVSIGAGIVALIPEYRHRILSNFLEEQDEEPTIRISSLPLVAIEEIRGTGEPGAGPLSILKDPPRPVETAFTRTDQLTDPFPEQPTVERPATEAAIPGDVESVYEPPPVVASPERMAAAQTVLQEFARATLEEPAVAAEARPDQPLGTPDLSRATLPSPTTTPDEPERPATGGVDRVTEAPLPVTNPESLRMDATADAALKRADDENVTTRPGEIPTPASADPTTGVDDGSSTRAAPSVAGTSIPRTGLPRVSPGTEAMTTTERPDVPSSDVNSTPAPEALSSGPVTPAPSSVPQLARVDPSATDGQVPAPYIQRSPELQSEANERYGGTPDSQAAVELSLKFLASAQEKDGRWNVGRWEGGFLTRNPDKQRRDFIAADLDVGVTALATLAFLGKGNTLEEGEYRENVRQAVRWLVSKQHPNGFIGIEARDTRTGTVPGNMAGMYGHGMASFALAEAFAMSKDWPEAQAMRRPIEKAVGFILATQLEDGGWRYFQYQTEGGDMSLFGWQLMALKSAQLGGIPIPARVRDQMVEFLKSNAQGRNGGLAAYRQRDRVTPAMTAEALFCRQVLGLGRESAASKEAVTYLLTAANLPNRQRMDLYYWYYGTLALFQYGDPEWQQWNVRVRDLLVSEQEQDGEYAGSWPPRDPWSGYGGRIYSTAMATLCLEVYYRYLPLYKQGAGAPAPAEPGER